MYTTMTVATNCNTSDIYIDWEDSKNWPLLDYEPSRNASVCPAVGEVDKCKVRKDPCC